MCLTLLSFSVQMLHSDVWVILGLGLLFWVCFCCFVVLFLLFGHSVDLDQFFSGSKNPCSFIEKTLLMSSM